MGSEHSTIGKRCVLLVSLLHLIITSSDVLALPTKGSESETSEQESYEIYKENVMKQKGDEIEFKEDAAENILNSEKTTGSGTEGHQHASSVKGASGTQHTASIAGAAVESHQPGTVNSGKETNGGPKSANSAKQTNGAYVPADSFKEASGAPNSHGRIPEPVSKMACACSCACATAAPGSISYAIHAETTVVTADKHAQSPKDLKACQDIVASHTKLKNEE